MMGEFKSEHQLDEKGNPTGGQSEGIGILINWQNGPLGRGEDRQAPNGAFVETVLAVVKDRINFYQTASGGRFACAENLEAMDRIQDALTALDNRTKKREAAGIEGTHTPGEAAGATPEPANGDPSTLPTPPAEGQSA